MDLPLKGGSLHQLDAMALIPDTHGLQFASHEYFGSPSLRFCHLLDLAHDHFVD
ncbi:MAG: hypothetical protein O9331_04280 [Acidovorax sp.]|nr:hypothetical protein [Acidovorax sp.]